MEDEQLGQLERVDLREIWPTEDQDFTPWLAEENNLKILAKTLNLELEIETTEKNVGPFSADVLCRNSDDGSWVLIENQLEKTDHKHLGQLLTYAAGLHAVTIVWVSANFTEEHRATLDWLNEITDDTFRFFGLEVELWRIGKSPPAPKFNIISKPNDWSRSISQAARRIIDGELSKTRATYLQYWTDFRTYLEESQSPLRPRNPRPNHYLHLGIGRSGYWLSAVVSVQEKYIGVMLSIGDDRRCVCIRQLMNDKENIEKEIGAQLDWREMPNNKASRMALIKNDTDPMIEAQWPDQFAWLSETLERFAAAFRQRIRAIDPDDLDVR